jgi:hypothetical protein
MRESSNKSQFTGKRFLSGHSFAKFLGELRRDLQDNPDWKYEQLSPIQLLERSYCNIYPPDSDELARANWFWSRRPRWLQAASGTIWFIVALGLPLWLFSFPAIGVSLIIIAAVVVNAEIVRSMRWRRQYELSIDRTIRTCKNGRDTFGMDILT